MDLFAIDDTPVAQIRDASLTGDHTRSPLDAILQEAERAGRGDISLRDCLLEHVLQPGKFAGTPHQIADFAEEFIESGVDGFNVVPVTSLDWWDGFVDTVVPVLQERGLIQSDYRQGTLREKLFGQGPHLPMDHRAAQYRGAFAQGAARMG